MNIFKKIFCKLLWYIKKPDYSGVLIQPHFVSILQKIGTHFSVSPKRILYIGGKNDISPKIAFPQSYVHFVDIGGKNTPLLYDAGMWYVEEDVVSCDVFGPIMDITISLGVVFQSRMIQYTRQNGLIICDDRYGCATHLFGDASVEIIGVISQDKIDETFLEEYFEVASNDADLMRAGVYYLYKRSIETINPRVKNVMSYIQKDYKKIMGTQTYLGVALGMSKGDISKVLPRKKGEIDSASGPGVISNICIFRKR